MKLYMEIGLLNFTLAFPHLDTMVKHFTFPIDRITSSSIRPSLFSQFSTMSAWLGHVLQHNGETNAQKYKVKEDPLLTGLPAALRSILYPVVRDLFEMKIEICHLPAKIFQCPSIRPINKNQTF